ncbi:MAG TPA: PqqD family peptide modification chaperone [Caulobacteraceae bacterium]|jgi:hypothetical protein
MAGMIVKRSGQWLSAPVGDDLVMMSADTGNYVTVSRIGRRIWELIEPPRSLEDLCAQLVREFEVEPEVCAAQMDRFLNEMAAYHAVELTPSPAG